MTRNNAKLLLPIIEAYSRGETIQTYADKTGWEDTIYSDLDFCSDPSMYRVKPKLRWLAVRKGSNFENNPDIIDGKALTSVDRNHWDVFIEEEPAT
jgi:hypothetical protein